MDKPHINLPLDVLPFFGLAQSADEFFKLFFVRGRVFKPR